MSSITWTPRAVASESAQCRLELWRAVEAQHVASTTRLVDSLREQALLEDILERTKPRTEATKGLHYLLATPFRYPPAARGSRFRGPADPGVFYGAEEPRTACAELGYWRWRFLMDSEGLQQIGPVAHTVFLARIQHKAVDLREKPFARDAAKWTHPADYAATQSFGLVAREAGVGLIRYRSVRDPQGGGCGAVLRPQAFSARRPLREQTWFLTVSRSLSAWKREGESFEFPWT